MERQTLDKANAINEQISILQEECKRLPRQYLDWSNKNGPYWKRMLVRIKGKFFVKFPRRYEGDKDTLLELTKDDLEYLVNARLSKIDELQEELKQLS